MSTSAPALNYYKLETEFHDGYVLHRTYEWQYSVRHETSVVKWTRGKTLGKGSSGVVWREEESGGEIRAVKCLERRSSHLMDAGVTRELLALITLTEHKHLFVQLLGWYENEMNIFIAMEFMKGGDLSDYIKNHELARAGAKTITTQVLEGLKVIHEEGMCHMDLKPKNVLVASTDPIWVKLADFGSSKRTENTSFRAGCGTEGYIAPELLGLLPREFRGASHKFPHAIDIWSLGCLLHEMLTSQTPFLGAMEEFDSITRDMTTLDIEPETDLDLLYDYCHGDTSFPAQILQDSGVDNAAIGLIKWLLMANPTDRPTASDTLLDLWLTGVGPGSTKDPETLTIQQAPVVSVPETVVIEFQDSSFDKSILKAAGGPGSTEDQEALTIDPTAAIVMPELEVVELDDPPYNISVLNTTDEKPSYGNPAYGEIENPPCNEQNFGPPGIETNYLTVTDSECFNNFQRFRHREKPGLSVFYNDSDIVRLAIIGKHMANSLLKRGCQKGIAMQLSTLVLYDVVLLIGLSLNSTDCTAEGHATPPPDNHRRSLTIATDDSTSMDMEKNGERKSVLKRMMAAITGICDLANPEGIRSVRFLNSSDNLKNVRSESWERHFDCFKYNGLSRIGSELKTKILDQYVFQSRMEKPLLIILTIDRVADGEAKESLHHLLTHLFQDLRRDPSRTGDAVAIQFALIGDDQAAQQAYMDVDNDPSFRGRMDVLDLSRCMEHLSDQDNEFKWLVLSKLLLGAIMEHWDTTNLDHNLDVYESRSGGDYHRNYEEVEDVEAEFSDWNKAFGSNFV